MTMAKIGKRTRSDWMIGAHPVNSYKARVPDPAVKRKRRKGKDIRRVLAQALNRVKDDGRDVYLSADNYKGRPKPKTLYRVELFKDPFYVLCCDQQVITLFTSEMTTGDVRRGNLVFRDNAPFKELLPYYQKKNSCLHPTENSSLGGGAGGRGIEFAKVRPTPAPDLLWQRKGRYYCLA
jgi:hypothetical protein